MLLWRLDPTFTHRIPEATDWDCRWILVCRHGSSSAGAAWQLRQIGLHRARDMVGNHDAWVAAGLSTTEAPADIRP